MWWFHAEMGTFHSLNTTKQPTTNPISNITSIKFYKYLNQIKYYSSHLINNIHSHLQEVKNIRNIYLNHLITPCKLPAKYNTATHHKSNFQHQEYKVLQVFKSNKILFITSNQQHSFTFVKSEKHSQYVFKLPYNTMQVTSLL